MNTVTWIHFGAVLSGFLLVVLPLLYAGIVDARTKQIPNRVLPFLLASGVIHLMMAGFSLSAVFWAVIGFLAGGIPLLLLAFITKGKCVGFGDIKLAACAGFALGIASYLVLMAALCLFLIGSSIICIVKKLPLNTPLPFGPFYTVTVLVVYITIAIVTFFRF
ncbi:prepilin peptidase [Ethanoligenens sp.]|uniref:prepilin peptidase n=1 Tax=Ethanoligenens sp. TaxID=2099655 RepID=UPI0039E8183C